MYFEVSFSHLPLVLKPRRFLLDVKILKIAPLIEIKTGPVLDEIILPGTPLSCSIADTLCSICLQICCES